MRNLKNQIKSAMVLGILSLVAGGVGHLALTDIYHAEADLSLEWNVLRMCALVILFFVAWALYIMRRTLREIP